MTVRQESGCLGKWIKTAKPGGLLLLPAGGVLCVGLSCFVTLTPEEIYGGKETIVNFRGKDLTVKIEKDLALLEEQ